MERVDTGIKGFDDLLGGGLPKGKCVLVVGSPGAGKTTFAMQYLYTGALKDERGLYVTLDERPESVKENLASFGWRLNEMENNGTLLFVDATPLRRLRRSESYGPRHDTGVSVTIQELTLKSLVSTIEKIVEEEGVSRIAIDPITSLSIRYEKILKRRRALLYLFDALIENGCTTLVTSELRTGLLKRTFQLEEYVSQGVILLHTLVHQGNVIRAIQIEKMRGTEHDTQLRPYQVTKNGIEVFPKDRVF